jgi:hypothetical protein
MQDLTLPPALLRAENHRLRQTRAATVKRLECGVLDGSALVSDFYPEPERGRVM